MAQRQFKGWGGSSTKPIPQTILVGAWQTDVPGRMDAFVIWDSDRRRHHVVGIMWPKGAEPCIVNHTVRIGSAENGSHDYEAERTPLQPAQEKYLLDCFREVAAEINPER